MAVPIRNIYYLLCYAWDRLEALALVDTSALQGDRVQNLLGTVLAEGVSGLLRAGLDRGYVTYEDAGRSIRGKILLAESLSNLLLQQGRIVCRADELSADVPHNRIVKAGMRA